MLTVTFVPAGTGCSTNPDCDDGNACNGAETCVALTCQAGTPLVCNDGNPCTTDTCNQASGCVATPVANGTSCSDGDACDGVELCQAGACAPGTPLVCNDGLACTSDTCAPVSGCVYTSTCGAGQVCSLSTGLCETPAAPPLPIQQGDTWRYFKGSEAPPANWNALGFTDNGWLQGPGGFGYGPDCTGSRGTTVGDMQNSYRSLFARRAFHVGNPAAVTSMTLTVDYDDAFVAYLNGEEVGRSTNIVGNPPAYDTLANLEHECSGSPAPNPPLTIDVTPFLDSLESGVNVFAIQGHNVTLDSSDFTLAVTLTATEVAGPQAVLSCAPATLTAQPSTSTPVTVRLENVGALEPIRGYQTQIAITRTSGAGTVAVSCPGGVEVDEAAPDYLFVGRSDDFTAVNCPLRRAASALASGAVTAPADSYLAGYTLDVLGDATPGSTFEIAVLPTPDSALADAGSDPVAFTIGSTCVLTVEAVGGCTTDPQCDDGNPCTNDTCQAGTCVNANNTAPCNDGNACTMADTCAGGACVGTPLSCDDADPCTLDTCFGGVCAHGPNGVCGVSGTVNYYRDSVGGIEPSSKPVPGVQLDVNEDATANATTGGAGTYAVANLSGRVVTEPLPRYGAPRALDHNGAITSFDASLIAQRAVGNLTLTSNQEMAADVTGNGSITSFDAALVSQFAVELIDHFQVATTTGSDWRFQPAEHVHDPIAGAVTDDFSALLYGDVSGNWTPAATLVAPASRESAEEAQAAQNDRGLAESLAGVFRSRAVPARAGGPAILRLGAEEAARLAPGERKTISVFLANGQGIEGLDLVLEYDPRHLAIVDVQRGPLAGAFQMAHRDASGTLRVGLFGLEGLQGEGALLLLTVEGRGQGRAGSLRLEAEANEGAIAVEVEVDGVRRGRQPRR